MSATATRAGVSLIPLSLGVVAGSMLAGQMVARFGHYKRWMLGGGLVVLGGFSLLATMPTNISYGRVLGYVLLTGIGLGPSMPLYTLAIQNAVDIRFNRAGHFGQSVFPADWRRHFRGAVRSRSQLSLSSPTFHLHCRSTTPGSAGGRWGGPARARRFAGSPRGLCQRLAPRVWLGAGAGGAGWLVTLLVPELPLCKSNASNQPAPAD